MLREIEIDEITHVTSGVRWCEPTRINQFSGSRLYSFDVHRFEYVCEREKIEPMSEFHNLVKVCCFSLRHPYHQQPPPPYIHMYPSSTFQLHFRGSLKPPFATESRFYDMFSRQTLLILPSLPCDLSIFTSPLLKLRRKHAGFTPEWYLPLMSPVDVAAYEAQIAKEAKTKYAHLF